MNRVGLYDWLFRYRLLAPVCLVCLVCLVCSGCARWSGKADRNDIALPEGKEKAERPPLVEQISDFPPFNFAVDPKAREINKNLDR